MDSEVGNASPETGVACLAMLAVDSLLWVIVALEGLTDAAMEAQEAGAPAFSEAAEPSLAASEDACVAMVAATWQLVLPALSILLARASGEVLVLKLLRVPPYLLPPFPFFAAAVRLAVLPARGWDWPLPDLMFWTCAEGDDICSRFVAHKSVLTFAPILSGTAVLMHGVLADSAGLALE